MRLYKSTEGYEYTEDEILEAAAESDMSIDDYVAEFKMTLAGEGEPGKKKPVAKKGAVATGKTKGTASKPATTSSGSKKVNPWETAEQAKKREATFGVGAIVKTQVKNKPVVTQKPMSIEEKNSRINFEDLDGPEEKVANNIKSRLSRFGLVAVETGLGNSIAIRSAEGNQAGPLSSERKLGESLGEGIINVGGDANELKAGAKALNDYIEKYGDKDFINKSRQKYASKYSEGVRFSSPKSRTFEEKLKTYNEDLISKFRSKEEEKNKYKVATGLDADMMRTRVITPKDVTLEAKDFNNPDEYKAYQSWKKSGVVPIPSTAKLESFIKVKNTNYREKKFTEFMADLEPEERVALSAIKEGKKDFGENVQAEGVSLNEKSIALNTKIQKAQKTPLTDSERVALINEYTALEADISLYEEKVALVKKEEPSIEAVAKTALDDYNRFNQAVTGIKSIGTDVLYAGADILTTGIGALATLGAGDYAKTKSMLKPLLLDPLYALKSDLAEEGESYQKDLHVGDIRSIKDAGRWGASVLTQMPASLALAVTGANAMPLFFLSGYGGKAYDIANAEQSALNRLEKNKNLIDDGMITSPEALAEVQKQMAEDKKTLAIPEGAKITSALLAGTAEVLFEKLGTLNLIKKTKHALDLIPPAEIKSSLKAFAKESFKSMPIEGGTEALTQLANNFGDIVLLGQDKNMFADVPDAFAGGAFMGPGFAAGGGMNNIAKAVAGEMITKAELRQREAKLKEIQKLTGLQDITGLTVREVNKLKLNPEVKKAVNELIEEMDGEDLKILDRLGNDFSIADAKKIGDFNMELRKILKEWATASKNGELSDSELKTLKDYYENKYNTTFTQREALLNNEQLKVRNRTNSTKKRAIFAMAEGTGIYNYRTTQKAKQNARSDFGKLRGAEKQPYYDKAAEELKLKSEDPNFMPKKSEIASKAMDIYTDEKLGAKLRADIKNAQQYVADQGLTTNMEILEGNDADAKSLKVAAAVYGKNSESYKRVVKGIKNKTFNGFNAGGKVVIHVPNSIRNGKTSVGSHEVLHSVVANALKNNQESADKAGFALLDYLQQEQPDLHAVVSTQMTAYDETKSGYGEEIMNALSDSFSDGGVPSDPVLTQLSKMLYKISKGLIGTPENSIDTVSLETADGKAIYELIKSFHNVAGRAEKGKVKARILITTPDKEDEVAEQENIKLSESIQSRMDALDDQLNNDEIDYDTYETKMDQLVKEEAKAIKLEKEKATSQKEEKKSTKTTLQDLLDKKYEGNKRKFISEGLTTTPAGKETFDFAKSDIGEQLGGLVESITRRLYDGIPADSKKTVSRADYKNALITAAATLIDKEWDPNKQDLDKFISNRLNLRANSLAKELGIEGMQQGGIKSDVEQAKGLMAEDTKQEVAEKPKYKTILESKVFSAEVVNSVKDKLVRELRTLKSKIDELVSINKTVTPLVAEIKEAMGKQADIDIKKALGGKPNNEFRSNLIKNKKAILENMTTTWLMGKDTKKGVEGGIPAAIQKQVDGKWLSYPDWVGKKIDREKVTTNLAGKTSGADVVRRLPNAVNNVSDADFLSSFLAPNGDLIRGRKESLSKAMAEELSFDIFRQGLEEGGPIAEAFEKNQELKNVVLADSYINEVGRQLERGTVKFSMSIEEMQSQLQGMVIDFVENKNSDFVINMYPDEVVEVARELGIISLFEEGPTGFKSQMKKLMESNPDMPGWDTYFATNTNKNSETSMDQLADFSSALMELLPPELLNSLPVDIFAMTYSYLDAAEQKQSGLPGKYNWLAKKFENLKSKESKGALPFNPAHIRLYNAGMGLMGRIATILEKPISANEKREMVNEKYGKEIANANTANKQALNYLFAKAAEVIANDPSLIPGFLRWMESSTSNGRGQRAFTGLELIEYLDGPQKNDATHALYTAALEAATKDANKAYNNKSKKFKDSTNKEDFIESYLANPNTGVNSKLRFKGEHVVAAANAMFELGKNTLKASELIRKFPNAKKEILNNLELENIPILAGYEQTLGAKVHSDIQDEKLGTTSKLGYFRNLALDSKAFDGFKTIDGTSGSDFLKNKMLAIEKINEAINSRSIEKIARDITFEKAVQKVAFSKSVNKIRVFDFDDTLARTKSNVLYTLPNDPKQYKIDAATFAKDGSALEKLGAKWDFSEFSKVMNGQKGPLFDVAKIIADKKGTDNVFVLTARPADSAGPIHEFLKELGLSIPVKNITGLGNSSPQAKADWIVNKAADGYNDFYFADDHTGNVKAVKDALSVLDVKNRVQQAKVKFSLSSRRDLQWTTKDKSVFNADFKVGEQDYEIGMEPTGVMGFDNTVMSRLYYLTRRNGLNHSVIFGEENKKSQFVAFQDKKRGMDITGTGNAAEVFGVVLNGLVDVAMEKDIKSFAFVAMEPSRIKLYNTLSTVLAERLGWNAYSINGAYIVADPSLVTATPEVKEVEKPKRSNPDIEWDFDEGISSTDIEIEGRKYRVDLEDTSDYYRDAPEDIENRAEELAKKYSIDKKNILGTSTENYTAEISIIQPTVGRFKGENTEKTAEYLADSLVDFVEQQGSKNLVSYRGNAEESQLFQKAFDIAAKKLGWQVFSDYGIVLLSAPQISADPVKFSKSISNIQSEPKIGLLNKAQADKLQKEIEANYNSKLKLGNKNNDIRTSMFNYDNPIARKMSNGIDLRITEGLIRNGKKTYLLYADGKIIGEFNAVNDAKDLIKYIEDNLIIPDKIEGEIKFSKSIDQQFNEIIETNKGIGAQKRYSGITSKRLGASKGNYKFFLPPGAEDFEGLLYNFLGKGKEGEAQAEFFERTLLAPYWEGVSAIESARQKIKRDFKALKKAFPDAADKITKKTPDGNFTYDQAIRVYLWTKEGKAIPELSRGDQARLNSLVANDPQLAAFANGLELVSGRTGGWSDPSEFWDSDTIVSELNDMTEKVGRKTYLEEFIKNADEIFSNDNMNKIEAIYGTNIREALEGALYRMKNGKNQSMGTGKATAAVNAWVNGSVAEIMFLNTKSGVLQLISALNYLNLRDNNPIMAGKALLDFPQFAKDFATIFNSDMMKERRQGLKEDVSAAEIANAAATSKNKVKAMSAYLAKIGFTPTTIADALAIGMGGAPFYRNRINTYEKQGMSKAEAEAKAWKDFTKLTNKSAQSNDPALISQQQAEPIGRIILAFGNATMQMNRIMKKSARDLINGRGNPIDHISRILFYGFIQNAIFSALQKAVFIGLFGDDDEEEEKDKKKQKTAEEKAIELADDMLDSFLRGSGLAGAVVSTAKNTAQEYFKQRAKKAKGDQAYTLLAGLNISPSIGSKARKIYGAIQEEKFNRAVIERMGGKVMLEGRFNPSPIYNVGAKLVAAGTNLPADRLLDKITNISEALDARNENWQRAMLMLGYKPFELGVKNEEQEAIKAQAKLEREDEVFIEGIEKKKAKIKKLRSMTQEEKKAYRDSIRATMPAKIERAKRRKKLLYEK